jgi:putative addiction module component (TIGR02574 family)
LLKFTLLVQNWEGNMRGIENLTRSEKLIMMEALWDDLAHDPVVLSSPDWHAAALQEAECAHAENQSDFISWEAAKKSLRDPAQ